MGAAKSWECAPFPLHHGRPWSPAHFPHLVDHESSTTTPSSRPSSSSSVSLSATVPVPVSRSQDAGQPSRSSIRPSDRAQVDNTPSPVSLRPHPDPSNNNNNNNNNNNIPSNLLEHHALAQLYNNNTHHNRHAHLQHQRNAHGHVGMPSAYHSDSALGLHLGYGQARSPLVVDDYLSPLDPAVTVTLAGGITGVMNRVINIDGIDGIDGMEVDAARKARVLGKAKIKNELYKTEICRSYTVNNGYCKYGAKCQFAHGDRERRPVRRHPRYKTKLCRNFVTSGNCPYGTRCRFIHSTDMNDMNNMNNVNSNSNSISIDMEIDELNKQNEINEMHDININIDIDNESETMHEMHELNLALSAEKHRKRNAIRNGNANRNGNRNGNGNRKQLLFQFNSAHSINEGSGTTVGASCDSPSTESPEASHIQMQELFSSSSSAAKLRGDNTNANGNMNMNNVNNVNNMNNMVGGRTSPVRSFSFSLEDNNNAGSGKTAGDKGDKGDGSGSGTSPLRSRLPVFQTLSSGGVDGGHGNVVSPTHN